MIAPPVNDLVLVTGAAGFAGGHLLEHLGGRHEVVAWARSAPPASLARLATWEEIDLLNREQVRAATRRLRPARVFHCAGVPHVAESWNDVARPLSGNALATHHLLEALRRTERRCRVLLPGSATVYAPSRTPIGEDHPLGPNSPYALSKLAQEQLGLRVGRDDGLEVVLTRSFNHTGPRQSAAFVAPSIARQIALIERGEREPTIQVGNLDAQRDITDVRDTVRAYAMLMDVGEPGTVYNVASGVGRPVRAILDALLARSHAAVQVTTDPTRLRPRDTAALIGDASRLTRATGWRPEIGFDQMLQDLLDYWRSLSATSNH